MESGPLKSLNDNINIIHDKHVNKVKGWWEWVEEKEMDKGVYPSLNEVDIKMYINKSMKMNASFIRWHFDSLIHVVVPNDYVIHFNCVTI